MPELPKSLLMFTKFLAPLAPKEILDKYLRFLHFRIGIFSRNKLLVWIMVLLNFSCSSGIEITDSLSSSYKVILDSYPSEAIAVQFLGDLTPKKADELILKSETILATSQLSPNYQRRIFRVSLEMLQNSLRHGSTNSNSSKLCYYILSKQAGRFLIHTGNLTKIENINWLRKKIEELKILSTPALDQLYFQVLNKGKISSAGGAGLGLITIMQSSQGRLAINQLPYNGDLHLVSLEAEIVP